MLVPGRCFLLGLGPQGFWSPNPGCWAMIVCGIIVVQYWISIGVLQGVCWIYIRLECVCISNGILLELCWISVNLILVFCCIAIGCL